MKKPLTPKQQLIYSKISSDLKDKQEAPTLEELKDFIKANSITSVVQHLDALEKKGYIFRRKNSKRNIELRNADIYNNTETVNVPVVASVGCDDLSVFTNEQHDEFIEVDKKLIGGKNHLVAVRAIGNSMNDANIDNGDYVLIELTDHAENGDRVAVIVGDMVTVKKLEKHDNVVVLRPESTDPKYKPIVVSSDFKIAGKVVCSIPGQSMDIMEVVPL